jgi:UDP-N-acetylglucosamine--N-acetylmuramyl-(pentapeptide) pyrophosphoryl-undecaprenol N-acetylglucosamine transferase
VSNQRDSAAKPSRPRVMITGGGTGGHVYPGLAVAESLVRFAPNIELRFVGTKKGLESVLVPRAGHHFATVPASGVRGLGGKARFLFLINFLAGFLRSVGQLLAWRPAVVLGTGGYVIGPVMAAARVLGIRCVLQEQNAVPGSANRLAARWAEKVYLGFAAAEKYFRRGRTQVTGNPVRAAFAAGASTSFAEGESPGAGSGGAPGNRVLVFGGSGGAGTLNRAMGEGAEQWLADPDRHLLVQTGPKDLETVRTAYAHAADDQVRVEPYIQNMAAALDWADLVICRAGAMTLAELQMMGKPAILVPFPHATDNHQLRNAEDCAEAGAAIVIEDADCTPESLFATAKTLLGDTDRLAAMGHAAREMSRPDAAEVIALDLLTLIGVGIGDPAGHDCKSEPEREPPVVS